jgi:IS30 family transposase
MPGAPLSLPEREEISLALIQDRSVSWVEIGRRTNRHPMTISRGVKGSGGRERYLPVVVDKRATKEPCRSRARRLAVPETTA